MTLEQSYCQLLQSPVSVMFFGRLYNLRGWRVTGESVSLEVDLEVLNCP